MNTRRPRIAILTNYPSDHTILVGGVESASAALLGGLAKYSKEFDFHVLALSRRLDRVEEEEKDGITFHFVPVYHAWYRRPRFISNLLRARRLMLGLSPDLVHCQDNLALALAALGSNWRKRIFTVHGIKSVEASVWQGPEYWSHKFDAILERVIRRQYKKVIAVSPYVRQFLPPGVHIYDVPNPVGRIFFETSHVETPSISLLFVGSLTRLKRPFDLIQAYAQVAEVKKGASLCLVGPVEDKKYREEMEAFIREKDLSDVSFRGSTSQAEVAQLMARSTVLLVPSIHENSPMVIAEAMVVGLPVIASAVGGIPMMIENDVTGFLFEARNIGALGQTIKRVLSDSALRGRVSQKARQMAISRYSSQAVADATMSIYRKILAE